MNTLLIIVLCIVNVLALISVVSGDVHFLRNNPSYRNRSTYIMLGASYLLWHVIAAGVVAYVYLVAAKRWWGIQIIETAILSYCAAKVIAFLYGVLDFQTRQSSVYRL